MLRYGGFYGPGTGIAPRRRPVRGRARPQVPARRATATASGRWCTSTTPRPRPSPRSSAGAPGIYNVVDDEPAPVREWLPALAAAAGAKPPRRMPRAGSRRLAARPGGYVTMMTEIRGASNAKARRELGWTPAHPSWRQGFQAL